MNASRRLAARALDVPAHPEHDEDVAEDERDDRAARSSVSTRLSSSAARAPRSRPRRPATAAPPDARSHCASLCALRACAAAACRSARAPPRYALPPRSSRPRAASAARRLEPPTHSAAPISAEHHHPEQQDQRERRPSPLVRPSAPASARGRPRAPNSGGIVSAHQLEPAVDRGRQREVAEAAGDAAVGADRVGLEARDGAEPERLAPRRGDDGDLGDAALPSAKRSICTITWIAELIWSRSASNGMWRSLIVASVSRRWIASSGELACTVTSEPSWPVLIACSMSSVSRAADLADDDAVGAHAQRVAHEVADRDLALALDVRRPGLERDDVRLLEPQLGVVLDGDDPLAGRHRRRQRVEQRRLAGARAAGDDDVELALDDRAQQLRRSARRSSPSRSAGRA